MRRHMKITILCAGKLKEKYFADAVNEYLKRIKPYSNIEIIEVPDEKAPDKLSAREIEIIKSKEGERLEKHMNQDAYKIALAIDGASMSSEKLAERMGNLMANGTPNFIFIIGGSLGLSNRITEKCDFKLSFSAMTFPHQLMRVILLEQIYRTFKIMNNEPYHK